MDSTYFIFLLVVGISSARFLEKNHVFRNRIVSGEDAEINEAPFVAAIVQGDHLICSAAILSDYWLITTANCLHNKDINLLSVVTGLANIDDRKNDHIHKISDVLIHPQVNYQKYYNNIALIKLNNPIVFNEYQQPIEVVQSDDEIFETGPVTTFGFGYTNEGTNGILNKVIQPVVDSEECSEEYSFTFLPKRMFCTRFIAEYRLSDVCFEDEGTIAVINGKLVGIISYSEEYGNSNFYSLFTRIGFFREWIQDSISELADDELKIKKKTDDTDLFSLFNMEK